MTEIDVKITRRRAFRDALIYFVNTCDTYGYEEFVIR